MIAFDCLATDCLEGIYIWELVRKKIAKKFMRTKIL